MKMRNNPKITSMFKGFRLRRKKLDGKTTSMPYRPKMTLTKSLFRHFDKLEELTQLQHDIIKAQLETCTEKTSPIYIAALDNLLDKAVIDKREDNK